MSMELKIDGQRVEVPEGSTVLDAARKLGVRIPTLCHLEGVEPAGSCFMCVVQVDGQANLVPSCVCPAEDGMEVTTDSEEVRDARRTALELLLSDHRGDCEGPCTLACPAGLDIPEFLRHVRDGRPGKALDVIRERIPLPGVLGRICPRYCERICRRREMDESIAICALKRYPADVEARSDEPRVPECKPSSGKSVGIVGGGAAGLTAAFYLLREGHACTIYDAGEEAGGALRSGIPEFRLPAAAIENDIRPLHQMGAQFRQGVRVGEDVSIDELTENHDAVLFATGAQAVEASDWQGTDLAVPATEYLRLATSGESPETGRRVAVLGGGNTGIAAARTAVRLGADEVALLSDQSRRRITGVGEYLDDAEAEGVELELEASPGSVEEAGSAFKVSWSRDGKEEGLEVDTVISATPRCVDTGLAEQLGLQLSRGRIDADRNTMTTSHQGVFAAGEAALGTTSAVRALASGRTAAVSICQYLAGEQVTGEVEQANVKMGKLTVDEQIELFKDYDEAPRIEEPILEPEERQGAMDEILGPLSDEAARREAARCLECDCIARDNCKLRDLATEYGAGTTTYRGECRRLDRDDSHSTVIYESGKCILCGLCVRISAEEEADGLTFIRRGFQARTRVPFSKSLKEGVPEDLARKVAQACPTGALALKRKNGHEEE